MAGIRKRKSSTTDKKTPDQAERDCDFIALHGWDWWRAVVEEAEQRASSASREDQ